MASQDKLNVWSLRPRIKLGSGKVEIGTTQSLPSLTEEEKQILEVAQEKLAALPTSPDDVSKYKMINIDELKNIDQN